MFSLIRRSSLSCTKIQSSSPLFARSLTFLSFVLCFLFFFLFYPSHQPSMGKDCVLLLVDASEPMFDEVAEGTTYFTKAMQCCKSMIMDKILTADRDLVGIVLFGTVRQEHISVLPRFQRNRPGSSFSISLPPPLAKKTRSFASRLCLRVVRPGHSGRGADPAAGKHLRCVAVALSIRCTPSFLLFHSLDAPASSLLLSPQMAAQMCRLSTASRQSTV